MGRDLQSVTQYQLTNDIVKNHYIFNIKDGALKVLLLLSTHYPEIYIQRKSLINRYKISEKTVDRALKELAEKRLIYRQNGGKITLNLAVIYSQIDGEKVVNLAVTCNNQHEKTEKTNKHDNKVVVSLLKEFSFSDIEIYRLMSKHSTQSLQAYAKYVQQKKAQDPKKYLLWCLKEKPQLTQTNQQDNDAKQSKTEKNAERYSSLLLSRKQNWMNNLQYAENYMRNTSQFDLRNEETMMDCIAIMLHWKLRIQDYDALMLIDKAAASNEEFRQKTANLTARIIEDLRTAKLVVDGNGKDCKQIAC